MVYLHESDTLVPNENVSHGLEFEASMSMRALERLVNKSLDYMESVTKGQDEIAKLKRKVCVACTQACVGVAGVCLYIGLPLRLCVWGVRSEGVSCTTANGCPSLQPGVVVQHTR